MFDTLTDRLQGILQKVRGEDRLTAENVDLALAEVRKALIEADVSLKVVKLFLSRVRQSAIGERVVSGITPAQKFIQIVNQELISLLGGKAEELNLKNKPSLVMLLGLQGSGKTTTAAKLALTLKKQNKKVLLAALDLQRPAAIEQLAILGRQIDTDTFTDTSTKDVLDVASKAWKASVDGHYDVVIFDTAGRLQVDNELMAELLLLDKKYKPQEKLLVLDSLMGQEAVNVAETFNTQIKITGAILTKLDGDSRGGAALSLLESTGTKIKFIGTGEKIEPLDNYDPERIASRILGFGDIISLVKKAEESFEQNELKALEGKLKKGELTFDTFLQMQRMMGKLGGFAQIFNLLGLNSAIQMSKQEKERIFEQGQQKLKKYEFAIQSMTYKERRNPSLINQSRIRRIAKGAGLKESQVSQFVKEFDQMRAMSKAMSGMWAGGQTTNLNEMVHIIREVQKTQKQQAKKERGGMFGGGSFIKF